MGEVGNENANGNGSEWKTTEDEGGPIQSSLAARVWEQR
jgi:hypothetical protein